MDFLDEQEAKGKNEEYYNRLQVKKQELKERLEVLRNEKFVVHENHEAESSVKQDLMDCAEILDSYRLLGLSIRSMGPDLVLRFDPLYRNQYPASEHYSVQLLRKGGNFELGKHNLPPFISANHLLEKYLENGIASFVEETRCLLYAFVQRREGLKYTQESFEDNVRDNIDVNLAVSYIKFHLWTSNKFPEVEVTLQYSLGKCLPDNVDIIPVEDEETYSLSKTALDKRLQKWAQKFLKFDIFTAVSDIITHNS